MQIPQLTFTHFLAALSVVIVHFGLSTWPINTTALMPLFTKALAAVSYFFVLSGFILVVSSAKNDTLPERVDAKKFWLNRCARILPLYLFSILIYFIFHFQYNPDIPLKWQTQSFVYSIFLLQSWDYHMVMDINYPAWTLSVEAFFYFIFPWLYVQLNQYKAKQLLYIILFSWIANVYLFRELLEEQAPHNLAFYYPLFHTATFLIGVAAGILYVRHRSYCEQKAGWIWGTTLVSAVWLVFSIYRNFSFWEYYHNGLLAPFFILIILSLCVLKGKPAAWLSAAPLVFLGNISYAVYLLQVPVKEYLQRYIPYFAQKDLQETFYWYVLILLLSSVATYYIIEKPMQKIIRNLASKKN